VAVSDERNEPGYVGLREASPCCDGAGPTILASEDGSFSWLFAGGETLVVCSSGSVVAAAWVCLVRAGGFGMRSGWASARAIGASPRWFAVHAVAGCMVGLLGDAPTLVAFRVFLGAGSSWVVRFREVRRFGWSTWWR